MQHSAFDLAVFARTYQGFRLHEAEQVRMLDEAEGRRQRGRFGSGLAPARLLAALRARFSAPTAPQLAEPAPSQTAALERPAGGTAFGRAVPGHQSIRSAEPYAAMVVLARAAAAPLKEQPSVVRDC